jgi:uncharacterized protein (DUF486 family)
MAACEQRVPFNVAVLPIRAVLYTLTGNTVALVAIQLLDGIGAGIFGVVSVQTVAGTIASFHFQCRILFLAAIAALASSILFFRAGNTRRKLSQREPMSTICLLMLSNVFMTFAWYGHLKYGHDWPLWKAILISWAIALLEYCLAVPANRLGFVQFSGFQLKIIQEVITISVFIVFAIFYLKEKLAWNYLVAFALLGVAAFFAFAFKAPGAVA